MNIQNQLQEVLISFNKYFLRKKGFKVIDDGEMNGGGIFQETLASLLSALVMTIVIIMIITTSDKKPLDTTKFLEEVKMDPGKTVNDIMINNRDMVMDAVKIVESNTSKGKELSSEDLKNIAETSIVAVRDTGNFNNEIKEIKDTVISTAAMVNANLSSSDDISDVVFSMADTYAENKDFKYDNTDNRHLLGNANRGPIIIDQHNVTSKASNDLRRNPLNINAKSNVTEPDFADTYAENKGFEYENTDREDLLRNKTSTQQHNVTVKATTYPKDFSRKSVKITAKAKVADDYLKAIGHKGGKSNKKRSRKQKLRRRKSLHKKR
jgi:hypothetical protein